MSETHCPRCGSPFKVRGLGQRAFHCGSIESETTGVVVEHPDCLRTQLAAAERGKRIAERALEKAARFCSVEGEEAAFISAVLENAEAELYPES